MNTVDTSYLIPNVERLSQLTDDERGAVGLMHWARQMRNEHGCDTRAEVVLADYGFRVQVWIFRPEAPEYRGRGQGTTLLEAFNRAMFALVDDLHRSDGTEPAP